MEPFQSRQVIVNPAEFQRTLARHAAHGRMTIDQVERVWSAYTHALQAGSAHLLDALGVWQSLLDRMGSTGLTFEAAFRVWQTFLADGVFALPSSIMRPDATAMARTPTWGDTIRATWPLGFGPIEFQDDGKGGPPVETIEDTAQARGGVLYQPGGCPPVGFDPKDRPVRRKADGTSEMTKEIVLVCAVNRLEKWGHAHDNPLLKKRIESTLDVLVPPNREKEFVLRSKGRRFSFTSAPQVGKGIIKVTAWGLEATTPIGNHDARKAPGGYNDSESSLQVYWSDPVARKSVFCSECPVRIVVPKHEAMGKRSTEPEGDVPYWFNFANDGEKFSKWHHGRPLPLPPKPGHVSLVIGTQAYRYMKIRLLDQFGDPLHPLYATPGEARSGPGASSVLYEKFTDAKGVFATEFKDAADSQGRDGWIWMNGWPDAPEHSLEFPSTVLDDNGVAKDVTFFFLVGGMAYVPGNPDIGPTREAARKDRTRNFFADAYEGRVPNVTEKRFIEKYAGTAKQHLCVWGHELSRDSAKTRSIGVWPPPGRKLPYYRVVDE